MAAMTRRDFMKVFSTIAFAGEMPLGTLAIPGNVLDGSRRLILIELRGGNDGLNTVVPYLDPAYIEARKTSLRLFTDHESSYRRVIPFSSWSGADQSDHFKPVGFGVHAHLDGLRDCWRQGEMAIIHGVGFNDQSRSHFAGITDWNRGVPIIMPMDSHAERTTGWMTRLWRAQGLGSSDIHAIQLSRVDVTPVFGPLPGIRSLGMSNPEDMTSDAFALYKPTAENLATDRSALRVVLEEMNNAHASRDAIANALQDAPTVTGSYPDNALGDQFRSMAKLIGGGLACPFYKIHTGGFDTHANQITIQGDLLLGLVDCIAALRNSLKESGDWDNTLIMTYSEFGRRLRENGSRGTDHGLANVHFMAGGAVRGGFYGQPPSLRAEDLDARGDIRPGIDVRRYFATAAAFLGFSEASRARALGLETGAPNLDLTPIDCFNNG
jgi:uncharacterized protein (DUF1501 family)